MANYKNHPIYPPIKRFHALYNGRTVTGCWVNPKSKKNSDYGDFNMGGREQHIEKAHRAAWLLLVGPIPPGMFVCHKCDNPPCANPAHLFLGTQQENMDDMHAKGRYIHGGRQRLPSNLVKIIRRLRERGARCRELEDIFGVSDETLRRIIHRKDIYNDKACNG